MVLAGVVSAVVVGVVVGTVVAAVAGVGVGAAGGAVAGARPVPGIWVLPFGLDHLLRAARDRLRLDVAARVEQRVTPRWRAGRRRRG